jgi:hypothetical protein
MDSKTIIYRVDGLVERGRPVIDFTHPIHWTLDWSPLNDVLDGKRKVKDYSPLELYVFPPVPESWSNTTDPSATQWDCYAVAGTFGLFSYRAIQLIGLTCFRHFEFIPARLNDVDYRFLRCKRTVNCWDASRAEVSLWGETRDHIIEAKKHAFDKSKLNDPVLFCVPELYGSLFATEGIRQKVLEHALKGFRFVKVH